MFAEYVSIFFIFKKKEGKIMDKELLQHSIDVSALATSIAYELELCPYAVAEIAIAGLYHDIGKECLPKIILKKPSKLTDDEHKIMTFHTYIGNAILNMINGEMSELVAEVALNHHEYYDGTEYYKKKYDEVSLGTRIVTVADVYSSLINDRVYRPAWSKEDALFYMQDNAGSLFDPTVVTALLAALIKEQECI